MPPHAWWTGLNPDGPNESEALTVKLRGIDGLVVDAARGHVRMGEHRRALENLTVAYDPRM